MPGIVAALAFFQSDGNLAERSALDVVAVGLPPPAGLSEPPLPPMTVPMIAARTTAMPMPISAPLPDLRSFGSSATGSGCARARRARACPPPAWAA